MSDYEEKLLLDRCHELEAEIVRLTTRRDSLAASLAKCEAENARLRAALQDIADYNKLRHGSISWATDIARRALEEKGE